MVFSLRAAVPGDEAAVGALLKASYGRLMLDAYGADLTERLLPVIAKANPELLASGSYCLAVADDDAVIGVGGWTFERPGTGEIAADIGHIRHVGTDPCWTGKGVGRAIIDHCVNEARAAGVRVFECYSSLNAVDFYRHLGFKEVRSVDIPMGGDLIMPSLLMERML